MAGGEETMKRTTILTLLALFTTLLVACGGGKSGKVLVTVGSEKITEGDLESLGNVNPKLKAQMATEFGRRKLLDDLIEQSMLYQASTKADLENTPVVKDKIKLYRRVIISQAYIEQKMEESAKEYYDANKNQFEKLGLSQIFIKFDGNKNGKANRSEKAALDLANEVKKKIDGGESFAATAKEYSDDKATAKNGGDMGLVSKDERRLVRRGDGPLLVKAFSMKVGEIGGPIKTEKGYHIITVTKGATLQPFDEVVQSIFFEIKGKAKNEIMDSLKEKYKITDMTIEKKEEPAVKAEKAPEIVPVEEKAPGTKEEPKETK